jgi:integrase
VDGPARATNWRNWTAWCARYSFNTFLIGTPREQHTHVLMAFAARVRAGAFGKGQQVGCQSVATALRHVAQAFVLASHGDPRREGDSPDLGLAFTRLYHSYRTEDPAPKPQLALPISVIEDVVKHEGTSRDPKAQALADLVMLAFFFLLRVGEYTPSGTRTTRTTQIRRKDMQFWHKRPNGLMDRLSPLATLADLLEADSVTITLDNQKNGQRDAVLHHEALPHNPLCPCKAAARRFVSMRLCDPTNANAILSLYAPNRHVTATQMAGVIRVAALRSMIWLQGYDLLRIGPHSLRASGAMQLKLNGVSDSMIQKMGRWSSNTWLQYLHGQISCLTRGLSARMATPVLYVNVGTRAED